MTSKTVITIKGEEPRLLNVKRKLKVHCAKKGITYLDFVEQALS